LLVAVAGSKRYGLGATTRRDHHHSDRISHTALDFHVAKMAIGRLANIDASDPHDRPSFYGIALLLVGLLGGCFLFVEGGSFMLRGCAAVAMLLGSRPF
jgi:hypothetical protein